ncbi:hypothetical protein AB0K40_38290 [Nonomuraea bangladeshensis]|uniref:ABC transporter permease n=1 Tax=Nonomuraea bangladeshensis TaxID=404385 RepID=A0ABV3HGC9_9ACTN
MELGKGPVEVVAGSFLVPFPAQPLAVELAAVATVLGLLGPYAALAQLSGAVAVDIPWQPVTWVIGLCCVLAVLAVVLPAARIKAVAMPRA